jgi:large subunit ribosomal protein L3
VPVSAKPNRRGGLHRLHAATKPPRPIDVGIVNKGASQEVLEKITMSMSEKLGLLGRKVGMMRIFTDDGDAIPVTVLDVSNNRVTQVKTSATDGYSALQIAFGSRKASRVTKPEAGHLAKAGVEGGTVLKEFRVTAEVAGQYAAGAVVSANVFAIGQKVDVQGTSIGKGFAGTIKRHNFKSQRASHGNSRSHNVPGSISMAQDPGRVFPGKKMTGHMGDETVTTQNLDIIRIDEARSLLLVRGAVPGSKNGHVVVRPAIKAKPAKAVADAPAKGAK